jgi:hypothetical protein
MYPLTGEDEGLIDIAGRSRRSITATLIRSGRDQRVFLAVPPDAVRA